MSLAFRRAGELSTNVSICTSTTVLVQVPRSDRWSAKALHRAPCHITSSQW